MVINIARTRAQSMTTSKGLVLLVSIFSPPAELAVLLQIGLGCLGWCCDPAGTESRYIFESYAGRAWLKNGIIEWVIKGINVGIHFVY
jgi:hypothetical protein